MNNLLDKDAKYLREDLDVLFIALNPPKQSNNNGHYFSGKQSTFYKQLFLSGLIVENIDRLVADDIIFGDNKYNYRNYNYGVIDLIPSVVETNSYRVKYRKENVEKLTDRIMKYKPRFVCIIHSQVKKAIEEFYSKKLSLGYNGKIIDGVDTEFFYNYFPNGNPIPTKNKVVIYKKLKEKL